MSLASESIGVHHVLSHMMLARLGKGTRRIIALLPVSAFVLASALAFALLAATSKFEKC